MRQSQKEEVELALGMVKCVQVVELRRCDLPKRKAEAPSEPEARAVPEDAGLEPDGREAEELRRGLEQLIEDATKPPMVADPPLRPWVSTEDLQALLDRVDARDSLTYLESRSLTDEVTEVCQAYDPEVDP